MRILAASPSPIIDMTQYPEHIVIYCLLREGISAGDLRVSNFEFEGFEINMDSRHIHINEGNSILEYVLRFQGRDRLGRQLAGPGVRVIARSAVRLRANIYAERTTDFWLRCPANSGGVATFERMDLINPRFNPAAPALGVNFLGETDPALLPHPDAIQASFAREHLPLNSAPNVEELRDLRISSFGVSSSEVVDGFGETFANPPVDKPVTYRSVPAPAPVLILSRWDRAGLVEDVLDPKNS